MFFKESNNFLTKENINFIENTILSTSFPYYKTTESVIGDNNGFLFHCLLDRPENRPHKDHINSPEYFLETLDICKSFFKKFKIKYKEILRMSINYTFNNGFEKCQIHVDHKYPHKQILIYLNKADIISKTIILNKNNSVLKEVIPKKYKGICFDNRPHYHFYPKQGERIVLVATFR
jgi:hypothetical protein